MKRTTVSLLAVLVVAITVAMVVPAAAHDYERNDSDHPLRYLAHLFHPIGIGLEYGVTRPIHWLVSQPHLRIVFGHQPRNEIDEKGQYPTCPICKAPASLIPCPNPNCRRPLMRPRDEYWVWK